MDNLIFFLDILKSGSVEYWLNCMHKGVQQDYRIHIPQLLKYSIYKPDK